MEICCLCKSISVLLSWIFTPSSFTSLLKFYTKSLLQSYKISSTKKVLFIANDFIRRTRDRKTEYVMGVTSADAYRIELWLVQLHTFFKKFSISSIMSCRLSLKKKCSWAGVTSCSIIKISVGLSPALILPCKYLILVIVSFSWSAKRR